MQQTRTRGVLRQCVMNRVEVNKGLAQVFSGRALAPTVSIHIHIHIPLATTATATATTATAETWSVLVSLSCA